MKQLKDRPWNSYNELGLDPLREYEQSLRAAQRREEQIKHDEMVRKAQEERSKTEPKNMNATMQGDTVRLKWAFEHKGVILQFDETIPRSCIKNWDDVHQIFQRIRNEWGHQLLAGVKLQDLMMEDKL